MWGPGADTSASDGGERCEGLDFPLLSAPVRAAFAAKSLFHFLSGRLYSLSNLWIIGRRIDSAEARGWMGVARIRGMVVRRRRVGNKNIFFRV